MPRRPPLIVAGGVLLAVAAVFAALLYARHIVRTFSPSDSATAGVTDTKAAIWCEGGACYWIDRAGFVTDTAPDTSGALVLVFSSTRARDFRRGERVVRSEEAERLFEIVEMLARAKLRVSEVRVDTEHSREIIIVLTSGEHLLFSTRFSSLFAEPILEALSAQGILSGLRYLDFRSENRAYYQ